MIDDKIASYAKTSLRDRLRRRWEFNKNSPKRARVALNHLALEYAHVLKKTSGRKLNKKKFDLLVERSRGINAKLMLGGLAQIPILSDVFITIVSMPPSNEAGNLLGFKRQMVKSLSKLAPAYDYSAFRVYASFIRDTTLMKANIRLSSAGYTDTFVDGVGTALANMNELILSMEKHVTLLDALADKVVDVLSGPKAREYRHARRQYELCCTVWSSILMHGPLQFLTMAVTTAAAMSECYD